MISIKINEKVYPMVVEPIEWMHGHEWVCHPCPQISDAVSDDIDADHCADYPGFVRDTIHYALIDGWTTEGLMREEDPDYVPIYWQVLVDGKPVTRDELQDVVDP